MEFQYRQSGKTQLLTDLLQSTPVGWKEQIRQWWIRRHERKLRRLETKMWIADRKERQAIARAFNDRYALAERFDLSSDEPVPGEWADTAHSTPQGNRWMCPTCNQIHAPYEFSAFSGLYYPSCCEYPKGPRDDRLGPTSELKRPLGWYGPEGLALKFRRANLEPRRPHYGDRVALLTKSKSKKD